MRKSLLMLCAFAFGVTGLVSVGTPTPAGAQTVKGPNLTWRLSLWGKRRAFTEGLEHVSAEVAKRTRVSSSSSENLRAVSLSAT